MNRCESCHEFSIAVFHALDEVDYSSGSIIHRGQVCAYCKILIMERNELYHRLVMHFSTRLEKLSKMRIEHEKDTMAK